VLAIAAAKLLHQRVLASDIDPRAARVAAMNARLNGVGARIWAIKADGWMDKRIKRSAPYDLVFANILARPLCAMACDLAHNMKPGGIAILAGLLTVQANWVLSAHRRAGLVLTGRIVDGAWSILILRKH
jgi:ribosomal protein L11 methyltransferase